MLVWKRRLFSLLCGIVLLLKPIVSFGAGTGDMLYIVDSSRENGRLKIVMNVVSTDVPDLAGVSVSFNGLGIDAFQFYPCEKFQPGVSLCIVPDVGSATDGRAMHDLCTIVDTLLDDMAEGDNACIMTAGENALSSDRDALGKQLHSLPLARGNRYDLLNAALDLLSSDASANIRAQIVVLSDGVSKGSLSEELIKRIEEARIPVYCVAMLYGTTDRERIAETDELNSVANGSHGGGVYDARIQKDSLKIASDGILASIGFGYVLELDAASVKKYIDPAGGVCKVDIAVGNSTISDSITLAPSDIPLGAYDPIGEYTPSTPEPEASAAPAEAKPGAPQEDATAEPSIPPIETVSPTATASPTDTAPPADTPVPTDAAAILTPGNTAVPEALPAGKGDVREWYKALALLWKILIPAGAVLVITGIIVLLSLRKRRRTRIYHDKSDHSISLGATVAMPPETAHATSINAVPVHLRIIRQPSDAESARYTLTVRNGLTIGSDPSVSQLIIDDDAKLRPADCRLALRDGKLYIYDLSKANDTGTALANGDTVIIGGFLYSIFWDL